MSLKCIDFLNVIKSIIVNDCFVICVGSSLLSKTVDVTAKSVSDGYLKKFCPPYMLIGSKFFLDIFNKLKNEKDVP